MSSAPYPTETAVYPARPRAIGRLLADLALAGGLAYLAATSPAWPLLAAGVWLLAGALAAQAVQKGRALRHPRPLLRVGLWGIQLGQHPPDAWACIWQEELATTPGPRGRTLLRYMAGTAPRRLDVSDCPLGAAELAGLLRHYRHRSPSYGAPHTLPK